ncbi:Bro-N domain-containing protein [Sphingomonas crocodyli]|uniref:Bro-N domain-containing protein n=1 Tax=Sphingomonas crocodyli TaxID=1979270 RepID=A0A437M126_9SPHN|nr:BRO family protein [Sphingomonas crocodyli]RVT91302.1 hypothetical protein EOD43_17505 [Sphingomonas crocodyli]
MTTNVIPMFTFNGTQLRGVKINGEAWFVASDVCKCLGLSNTTMALRVLDADEKSTLKRFECGMGAGAPVNAVSRPGMLRLVERSSKPEAKEFNRWVRHEVLPQVMDNGGYVAPNAQRFIWGVASGCGAGSNVRPRPC